MKTEKELKEEIWTIVNGLDLNNAELIDKAINLSFNKRNAEVKQVIEDGFDGAIQGTKKMDYYPDIFVELKKELLKELGLEEGE